MIPPATRPVVLLHGAFLSGASFTDLIRALGPFETVTAPDLPGHGLAPDPPAWTVAAMADVIARDLQGPAHVCGHSLGGMVALQLAVSHPQLVASLTLMESSAGTNDTCLNRVGTRVSTALIRTLPTGTLARLFGLDLAGGDRALQRDVERAVRAFTGRRAARRGIWEATATFEAWSRLDEVRVPTLVLTGALNPRTAAQARRLQAGLPEARWVVVPGGGHLVPQQQPVRVAQALQAFWDGS